jgi:hypothetical protein
MEKDMLFRACKRHGEVLAVLDSRFANFNPDHNNDSIINRISSLRGRRGLREHSSLDCAAAVLAFRRLSVAGNFFHVGAAQRCDDRLSVDDGCPQSRMGEGAGQGMRVLGNGNRSQLALCLKSAPQFLLSDQEARAMIFEQVNTIKAHWDDIRDEALLSAADRALLYGRQFLNPFAFYGALQEIRSAGQL